MLTALAPNDQPDLDSGALTHDDAVAGAVTDFQRAMMIDVDQAAKAMRDEEMMAEIGDFLEGDASRPASGGQPLG